MRKKDATTESKSTLHVRAEKIIETVHTLDREGAIHLITSGNQPDTVAEVHVNENGRMQLAKLGIQVVPMAKTPPNNAHKYTVTLGPIYTPEGQRSENTLHGVLNQWQIRAAFEPILARMAREEMAEMAKLRGQKTEPVDMRAPVPKSTWSDRAREQRDSNPLERQ